MLKDPLPNVGQSFGLSDQHTDLRRSDRLPYKSPDRPPDRPPDKPPDRLPDRPLDRTLDRQPDRPLDRPPTLTLKRNVGQKKFPGLSVNTVE